MKRRRFLAICAAFAAAPALATVQDWQGRGLGSALSLRLVGVPAHRAALVWQKVEAVIARVEAAASLYQDSALVRLNRDGHLTFPNPDLAGLVALSGQVHHATKGAFDPSIQPLWRALALGEATDAPVGWQHVQHSATSIKLPQGGALTFNGIAQGWAADQIAGLLGDLGFTDVLIDMGEVMAMGQSDRGTPWRVGIADAQGVALGQTELVNRALATSSPRGTLIGGAGPHILHPMRAAHWDTIAVSAPSAALADALSTAFCLMPRSEIDAALRHFPSARLEHSS
jgi:thiamine biosynthesis lipoprotein